MANIFDTILAKGSKAGQTPGKTQEAREWYRSKASTRNVKQKIDEHKFIKSDPSRMVNSINPGSMYLFHYDPKHKETLPYYDRVPLIFPFEMTKDGFYGLNVHYLPPLLRAKLMDGLYDYTNNKKYDDTTKVMLSYKLLKSIAKLRYFEPCVKRYLSSHVRSQFMYIQPSEWDVALFLPLAKFEKKSINYVYNQSRRSLSQS
jgi:hypothetical protein